MTRRATLGGRPADIAVSRLVAAFLTVLSAPIVARALGPEGRGVSATMLALLAVIQVTAGLGVASAIRRRAVELGGESSDPETKENIARLVGAGRLFAVISVLISVPIGVVTNLLFFSSAPHRDQIAYLAACILVPLTVSWSQDVAILLARRQFLRIAIIVIVQALIPTTAVIALWGSGLLDVAAVVYASVGGGLGSFALGLLWVRSSRPTTQTFRDLIIEGMGLAGFQIADLAGKKIDQVVALAAVGASGAGIYSVASTVSGLSTPVAQSVAAGMYSSKRNIEQGNEKTNRTFVVYPIIIGIPTTIILLLLSFFAIVPVFGQDFVDSVIPAVILSFGAPAVLISLACANWLTIHQKGRFLSIVQLVGLTAIMAASVVLGVLFGVTGIAVGVVFGLTLNAVLLANAVTRAGTAWIPKISDVRPALRSIFR